MILKYRIVRLYDTGERAMIFEHPNGENFNQKEYIDFMNDWGEPVSKLKNHHEKILAKLLKKE